MIKTLLKQILSNKCIMEEYFFIGTLRYDPPFKRFHDLLFLYLPLGLIIIDSKFYRKKDNDMKDIRTWPYS